MNKGKCKNTTCDFQTEARKRWCRKSKEDFKWCELFILERQPPPFRFSDWLGDAKTLNNTPHLYEMTFLLRSRGYLLGKIVLKSKRTPEETAKKLLKICQRVALKCNGIYPTQANFVLNT